MSLRPPLSWTPVDRYNLFQFAAFMVGLSLGGFLVGAEFPLANTIYLKQTVHYSQTAGKLYAADLIGSWVGALFVTIAFIPLFGIINTCMFVLFVNLCSLLLFVFSKR